MDKALNRLAVRIRSIDCSTPGAAPAGGSVPGASASGRLPARNARAVSRDGESG